MDLLSYLLRAKCPELDGLYHVHLVYPHALSPRIGVKRVNGHIINLIGTPTLTPEARVGEGTVMSHLI